MNTLPMLFQSPLLVAVPIGVLLTLALLMTAGLHVSGAKPEGVAKASGSYILKTFGLILVGLSSVQMTFATITMKMPSPPTIFALVLLFSIGLGVMIHESRRAASVDAASLAVPHLVFCYLCKVLGTIVVLLSALSLIMTFMFAKSSTGWEMPATLLLLGALLTTAASVHVEGKPQVKKRKR